MNFFIFSKTWSNFSCGKGLFTLPHQTRFSLAAFLTMNLSLAARPVCLPVVTTREPRLALAEEAVEEDLPRRRGEQIGAAHHLRDAHGAIVHDHRELVSEDSVGAAEDEVADDALRIEFLIAEDLVVESEGAGRDPQPQ